MSVNRYDASTGELKNIASGQRTWVGTQAAYRAAKQAGTLPNNAIIAITDDEQDHNHYSTDEVETGMYWIDGKPIYRKVVDCGALPNATSKSIPHYIDNIDFIVSISGISEDPSIGNFLHLPYPYSGTNSVYLYATKARVSLTTEANFTNYSQTFVILDYTKTTD